MKDYGADPINENGIIKFRMIPSNDIVDYEEKCNRLKTIKMSNKINCLIGAYTKEQINIKQGGKLK